MPVSPDGGRAFAKALADLYADAAAHLLAIVSQRLAAGIDRRGWAENKLSEVLRLRRDAQRLVTALADQADAAIFDLLADAYAAGVLAAGGPGVREASPGIVAANRGAVQAYAAELAGTVQATHTRMLRSAEDVYRRVIADTAGQVVTGVQTRREAAARAVSRLAAQGVRGFTDRAGRSWELGSYVEMATRTAAGQAHVQGGLDRYTQQGRYLVIVSNAPEECGLCLVPGTVVEGPAPTWRSRLEYRGDVLSITTASGKNLTGTPNHPVLTPLGWRRLDELHPGDQVISHDGQQRYAGVVPDDVQVPALIEEAGEARAPLLLAGPTRRDLDQSATYREVRAVLTHDDLLPELDTPLSEPLRDLLLVGAVRPTAPLLGLHDLSPDLDRGGATGTLMGGFEHGGTLLGGGELPPQAHGLTALRGQDFRVHGVQSPLEAMPLRAGLDTGAPEVVADRPIADAEGGAELLRALSGQVAADEVLTVGRREFRGHVWDLSTGPAWFVANGIVTHNCRPFEGTVLSLSGREPTPGEVEGHRYAGTLAAARSAGLLHPSCRHSLSAFVPGLTRPLGAPTADPDGDRERQQQRALERGVRETKRAVAAARQFGDTGELAHQQAKLRRRQEALRSFIAEHDRKGYVSELRTNLRSR